jgi:hypothetical protein
MIKYEKKSVETPTKTVEWIEATFDDSDVIISIPIDPANSDYQRYLNPEAEQSTPKVAAK